jgi:hypothetical protein
MTMRALPASDYQSLDAFYFEDPIRAASREVDYGVDWHDDGRPWPRYRVSWLEATGELVAVTLAGTCAVRVLAILPADEHARAADDHRAMRAHVDRLLDGWQDAQPAALEWVIGRVRP